MLWSIIGVPQVGAEPKDTIVVGSNEEEIPREPQFSVRNIIPSVRIWALVRDLDVPDARRSKTDHWCAQLSCIKSERRSDRAATEMIGSREA